MAGIGYALEKLILRDDLLGSFQSYTIGAIVSAGPWLFTIISLVGINLIVTDLLSVDQLSTFRIILIYNYSFSLVLSGPIIVITTRYFADQIYKNNVDQTPAIMLLALGLSYSVGIVVAVPFYIFFAELPVSIVMLAITNYLLITSVWVVTIFVTAIKEYRNYILSYAAGMLIAFFGGIYFFKLFNLSGLLFGYNLGLTVIIFSIIAKVLFTYPYEIQWPQKLIAYFKQYWELSLFGLFISAGIWIDKWIMWFSPEQQVVADVMVYNPDYDTAMFLAYLSILPSLAYFLVSSETGFNRRYQEYYQSIKCHATFSLIQVKHRCIIDYLIVNFRNIFLLQAAISLVAIIIAPHIILFFEGHYLQLGMLRFGILGAFFYVFLLFISTLLLYFDLRRLNLLLALTFLILNGSCTYWFMQSGYAYYGYGFFLASLVSFIVGLIILSNVLLKLPYYTFIKNNPSAI